MAIMDIATRRRGRAAVGARRRAGRRLRVVLAASAVVLVAMAGPAPAQTQVYVGVPPPTVPYSDPPTTVIYHPLPPKRAPIRSLAVTGSDVAGLCVLAVGALGCGVVLTRLGRRAPAFGGPSLLER